MVKDTFELFIFKTQIKPFDFIRSDQDSEQKRYERPPKQIECD